jgi:1-phosphofructokinase family hexose kinase
MIGTVTVNPAIDKIYLIDDFGLNQLHRISDDSKNDFSTGGKGVNVSVMLNGFGVPSVALGFTGGVFGKKIEIELRALGITTSFIRTQFDTRANVYVIDNKNDSITEINESGSEISREDITLFLDRYQKLLNQVSTMVLAGSILPGMDGGFYSNLVRLAKAKNVKAIVHTAPKNIYKSVKEGTPIIFPDMRSTCEFDGKKLDSVDACLEQGKQIIKEHKETEIVLFSHLVENIVAITNEKKAYVFSQKDLKLANLIGFSDAIIAGVAYGIQSNMSIKEMLCFGCVAGYTTIERNQKYCADLKKIKERVASLQIEELSL